MSLVKDNNLPAVLLALIAVQTLCAVFFVSDAVSDAFEPGGLDFGDWHLWLEWIAALSLVAAVLFEGRYLRSLMRRKARLEQNLSMASGALHEVIEQHFRDWDLTPAESDVALFTIKGLSIAEIAELRGSAPGTVKSQLNAIYRKSGVSGRGGLLALLIEDLLETPLLPEPRDAA